MVDGRPHWETRFHEAYWPAFEDFRNCLALGWDHLGLPPPTKAQLEIAHRLQYGMDSYEWTILTEEEREDRMTRVREDIIRAFRGLGKSYVTCLFAGWLVARNPRDEKVLVISATGSKAKQFVSQLKGIMESMELFKWLLDGTRENGATRRDTAENFDVQYASLSQACSIAAAGITGQITGNRATTLIADDMEIEKNSKTEEARSRILNSVRSDFVPITKTEHGKGDIICLGTPQTEESVYNVMVIEMGFSCFCVPARMPSEAKRSNYLMTTQDGVTIDILAPYLQGMLDAGEIKPGEPTDSRFDDDELIKTESKGRASFALQYMLDTSLSDAEKYPLRQHDLIIFSTHHKKAPLFVQWGHHNDRRNLVQDIPNLGFSGDYLLRPLKIDEEWRDYEGTVLFVDPAGRGKDETAWAIVGQQSGTLYALHVDGHSGDPAEAMIRIATDAKRFDVNTIEIEPNYAQGVWIEAFQPVLARIWPGGCTVIESEWAKGQKEKRVIGTLEPVMTAHRLVLSEEVARAESKADEAVYSLLYQLTHITHDRGCLKHDDRLEALAGAVAHFMKAMAMDSTQARDSVLEQEMNELREEFIEAFEGGHSLGLRRGKRRAGGRTEVTSVTLH